MSKRLVIPLVVVVVVIAAAGTLRILNTTVYAPKISSTPVSANTNYTAVMENYVKSTFSGTKYKNVVTYINLAHDELDLAKRYTIYLKAYSQMQIAYSETKKPEYKQAIVKLKTYTKAFDQYKEGDMTIPQ